MAKEIIVNVLARETRVALVDGGKLVELHLEREEQVAGSIYKCKVANVLPGMDAAFVDIALDRNAFLYAGDVLPEADEDVQDTEREPERGSSNIKDLLKIGQELLVQVVKAPRGTKGARVSTRISLPGRCLVLMPESENVGISRKIDEKPERDRLKKIAEQIRPKGYGIIVRTEAEGSTDQDLKADLEFLLRMWDQIQNKAKTTSAPGLIHQDLSLLYRTIRDSFGDDVRKMFIDSENDYRKAIEVVELISPKMRSKLVRYKENEPIFEHFGLEGEIDRLLRRKVWIKSGGHVTIDQTEALTTIDVNTGKFIGSTSLSDTIVKTNLEAAAEIARQLRLRDIGGIIIIDFIDMSSARDRNHVVTALDKALKKDRTRSKISNISPLGLVEMTRKRTGATISEVVNQACPYCQARGTILSSESVSLQIERELKKKVVDVEDDEAIVVYAHPDVAGFLIGGGGQTADAIERHLHRPLYIRANSDLHIENYEIVTGDIQELESEMLPHKKASQVECEVVRSSFVSLPRSAAWANGYMIDLANGGKYVGQQVKARLTKVTRSYAQGEVIGAIKAAKSTRKLPSS